MLFKNENHPKRHVLRRIDTVLFGALALAACAIFGGLACAINAPTLDSIRDSKLLDRRIKESPRQKVIRECNLESDRFRVGCVYCHSTADEGQIRAKDLKLTANGMKARIMRHSPAFGLNQNCNECHHSGFKLNRNAEKLFGPGGSRYEEAKRELKADN